MKMNITQGLDDASSSLLRSHTSSQKGYLHGIQTQQDPSNEHEWFKQDGSNHSLSCEDVCRKLKYFDWVGIVYVTKLTDEDT